MAIATNRILATLATSACLLAGCGAPNSNDPSAIARPAPDGPNPSIAARRGPVDPRTSPQTNSPRRSPAQAGGQAPIANDSASDEPTNMNSAVANRPAARSEAPERSLAEMLRTTPSNKEGLEPGDWFPEISGKDMEGSEMRLSDYRGQVVMLDFWGDW